MLERWTNKIKNFFDAKPSNKTNEENESSIDQDKMNRSGMQAKVKYEYPNKTLFRFPLIPDQNEKIKRDEGLDIPAYQRNQDDRSRNQVGKVQSVKKKQEDKMIKKKYTKPFVPSEVPSPIYGYQNKKKEKEIENIPTFLRNQQVEKEKENIETFEEKNEEEQNVDIGLEENPTFVNEREKDKESEHERKEEINTLEETNVSEKTVEEPKLIRKPNRHKNRQKQKRNNKQSSEMVIPYNVMMTPQDKKKLKHNKMNKKEVEKEKVTAYEQINPTDYSLPHYLLDDPEESSSEDQLWVQRQQQLLEKTLKHFNVKASVVHATQGPSVTRFEVQPELGVKVSKIRNLSDDIKMNMSAKDIRIEAPIPGKNTVGIEIPNLKSQTVGLQEILQTNQFEQSSSRLTIGLGLTVEGKPLVTNISKMPHGLIAGATGSGKSVCINTILLSLLYKSSYEDVKLLLIDPKMVELAPYNGIPHLVSPVITDIKAATAALKWAVNEMEDRYERFVNEGVRDIDRFNQKMAKEDRSKEKMPFIVIVIDELADLMMASPQDVEDAICRIAQKARACGMHLLIATQRPSVDVITGLIKANIPTRIAFSVSSQVDSRTIIDTNGAERLLGKGDMLFIENGSGKSVRLQGPFVSDDEIERVTNHLKTVSEPDYLFAQDELLKQIEVDEEEDELFEQVVEFVSNQNSASTSLLQRQFRIGYNRAARLIDALESKGIISGYNGSKPRDVLLSKSQMEELIQ